MKYYLIYDKMGKFIGYTDKKEYVEDLKNKRKGKFTVSKISDNEISDKVKNSISFNEYMLDEYHGYFVDTKAKLFNYELYPFEEMMMEDALQLQVSLANLLEAVEYIKISDEKKAIIENCFKSLIDDISAITDSNEIIFDEVIDVDKHFYERFLKKRK